MAKNKQLSYNDIPDLNEDWGLDPRNGLRYSGESVQKFIKEKLNSKMGYFHYDATSNRYLCFADEASKDAYVANPTLTELVLGAFDAPFNYEATITLLTPSYNAVFLGSTGNYIDFTFDIKNKEGNSTGENVNVTYTFIRNANKKVVTEVRKYGESVHLNIDEYLLEGANTVIVGITGQTSLAATTAAVTYQVVNLTYSDDMNIAQVYDLSQGNKTMEVFFSVNGYGTKTVEWFLDGEQLDFVKSEDEVVDVSSDRTKYIELSNLASGVHTLQSRAYTIINGEKFYTSTLYREILVNNGDVTGNLVAVATELPQSHGIVTSENQVVFYGVEQYIPYEVRFATRRTGDVTISLGGEVLATVTSTAGSESLYSITSNKAGTLPIKFSVDGVDREVPVSVNTSSLDIEEITNALTFDFRAVGKSNASIDKDVWSYDEYTGTFSGFNWNASSGWVNNALLINSGASFSVDIAPLANNATSTGKTLEFEFSARNVEDDDAVVCNLTSNGVGLLITASEARLTSAAGEVVNTRFKAGEVNRIAFVINRKTGVTYKGLAFIYVNGILSGAVNYGSADNFLSSAQLSFNGTEDVQVELRAMRFYDTALSADNILNNYVLYRDSLNEMMEVYYRNEIYAEGTQTFSPDLMLHRLPVMIITGDIPTLEAATSTSTQILVDIDYTNEQDPTKNFTMKNAALRIQGTSSLAYPRKNFRFYTQKEESTVVRDAEGNIIESKLYSFKDGAQPVDCWCLKADFAESSGTHNTGIARIWNKAMYGAVIQHKNVLGEEVNGYELRTEAQKAALGAGYEYDVRTTIDGFPIVLFYKKNASDTDLIFLGKYNFNNDKSTPSVFGFENIPDFDNSRMQCWETKDNGHPLGLFTDVSDFDSDWSEAFESRYPDTKTPNTTDLKSFSVWMNGVSQEDFVTEKWAHMDVYKVAAYYCYLMRFGAVDQPVKNAFLTSEDGEHFFFINYDNDTINGLINTGRLVLDPTINRDTIGSDGEYVYAGHNSVLWNRCEADTEFMDIVSIVDNALYSAGLRYDEVIAMFNDEQADKWVERVYNQDAEYKYLLPYVNQATNNLFMLQGARSSHRSWWLSKRFSLYDSLFVSGNYKDRNISFKCLNDTQPGQRFTITAGTAMNYGYGVNNGIRETGVALEVNGTHTFTTTDTLNLGDVVKIYAAANLSKLDFSQIAPRLAVLDCSAASDPALGSKLKELILGNAYSYSAGYNNELSTISGLNVLTSLQKLNIQSYRNIKSLDLSKQTDLRKVYAVESGLSSIDFATGAPVEYLELPREMIALNLNQLPYLTSSNVLIGQLQMVNFIHQVIEDFAYLQAMNIYGCPNITNDFSFVQKWLNQKLTIDASCTLAMDGVDWNTTYEEFLAFSQHKANGMKVDLKGKVYLNSLDLDQANALMEIWGNEVFEKNADFRITAPDALYINPSNVTLNEGESVKFSYILFSSTDGVVTYNIVSGSREGVTLDENTGMLTTIENGTANATLYIRAIYTSDEGNTTYATATVLIKKRIYPTSNSLTISGAHRLSKDETYTWSSSIADVNGNMEAEWLISGEIAKGYVSIGNNDLNSCTLNFIRPSEEGVLADGRLTLRLKKKVDGSLIASKDLLIEVIELSYPTESNTTINGDTKPEGNNPVYTWESTATGEIGPMSVEWSLDDVLKPYYEIQSQEWDEEDPLHGSVTLTKIMDVEAYMSGNINLTITRTNTGESFTISKELTVLNPNVIMTDKTNPAVLSVMYNNGLCANSTYMTKQEAEAVQDGTFNSAGTYNGSIFYNNTEITSFDEFRYFTGMTTLDAYAFYGCTKMASLKVPGTVTHFGTNCCYRDSSLCVALTIDSIDVETVASYAFNAYSSTEGALGSIKINNVNWYCTETCSTSRQNLFYYAHIMNLNVYELSAGYSSTSSSYRNYQHFYYAYLHNIVVDESITSIPQYVFYSANIYGLELPDSVTSIDKYAFSVQNATGFNVNRMSNAITTLGDTAFSYATFKTNVSFNNLTFPNVSGSLIKYSKFEHKLDISKNNSKTFRSNWFFIDGRGCAELIIQDVPNTMYLHNNGSAEKLTIPNIVNYCAAEFEGYGFLLNVNTVYTKSSVTDEYVQVTDFNPSDWMISSVPAYAFYGCKAITGYDATSIKDHNTYVFYNSGIKTLKLDNFNGTGTIASYAFASCASLETITDNSIQPWATLNNLAFKDVNANVKINSQVFGLYKQSTGFTLSPMDSGVVYALAFGDYTFTAPSGSAFGDGTTSKTLTLGSTGAIEDLTERLKIEYLTLTLTSNKEDAQFTLSYTASDGTEKNDTVTAGNLLLNVTKGTVVTVTPVSTFSGWTAPAASTVTMSSTSNAKAMDYTEEVNVYIAHKNGTLYTESEWTASGNSNDDSEGVCVMRALSGGFIIAKENASSSTLAWGGYQKTISGIVTTTTQDDALRDFDGYGNTPKIIEQLSGYTDSQSITGAPAAEACAAYIFPSGQNGYLPALGEWNLSNNNKESVVSAMSIIAGTSITENSYYWSSTQGSNTKSYRTAWYSASISSTEKYRTNAAVRAFAPIGRLTINSTLATKFTVSYTNNYNEQVTQRVGIGGTSLNVKVGTQVTVTPDAIGDITAEPQTFTWEGFRKDLSFVFAKDAGVYIQHVNGSLHTEAEWTAGGYANSDANGVAILSETVPSFVIAKMDVSGSTLRWGGDGKTVPDIVTSTSSATALLDYDGAGNTPKIIEYLAGTNDGYADGAPAAEACAAFTFPNGKKGYFPALGEWQGAYNNKTAVVSAMTLIGGIAIQSNYYWSSTQFSSNYSWTLYWNNGNLSYDGKRNNFSSVRAFTTL